MKAKHSTNVLLISKCCKEGRPDARRRLKASMQEEGGDDSYLTSLREARSLECEIKHLSSSNLKWFFPKGVKAVRNEDMPVGAWYL